MLKNQLTKLIRYSFEYMRMFENGTVTTKTLSICAIDMLAWQIACIIANHTVNGPEGCDHNTFVDDLVRLYNKEPNFTISEFVKKTIKQYGGSL